MQTQSPVREHTTIDDVEMVNCLVRPPGPSTLKAAPDDDDDELDEQMDGEDHEDLDDEVDEDDDDPER